jgi:large subunit ribosomal protein L32
MRHNRSQVRQRRSHHALKPANLTKCSNCGALRRPHHMCQACGFYRGRMVIDLKAKATKRASRIKATKDRLRADQNAK